VKGTVTFTDNAAGSPQTVSLSGTAVTPSTLTGTCVSSTGLVCMAFQEPTQCPVGKPAVSPEYESCNPQARDIVDTSSACGTLSEPRVYGSCEATSDAGSCSVQGQQCGAAGSSPCCSGFACTAGADGSSCQPATGESASTKARSSWDERLADRLR